MDYQYSCYYLTYSCEQRQKRSHKFGDISQTKTSMTNISLKIPSLNNITGDTACLFLKWHISVKFSTATFGMSVGKEPTVLKQKPRQHVSEVYTNKHYWQNRSKRIHARRVQIHLF